MDRLKGILEHLAVSRVLVAAIFVTATIMFVGPRLAPDYVPRAPETWLPVVFGAMVLSGCLLVLWAIAGTWHALTKTYTSARAAVAALNLTQEEAGLLGAMGKHPGESLNLEKIDYGDIPITRLELQKLLRSLDRKGLVRINQYYSHLASLTEAGEERILEMRRASRE